MSFVRLQDTRRGFVVEYTKFGEPKHVTTRYIVTDVHGPLLKSFAEPDLSGGHCRGSQVVRLHWYTQSLDGLADLLELHPSGMGIFLRGVPVRSLKIIRGLFPLSLIGNTQCSPDDHPFYVEGVQYGQRPHMNAIPAEWQKAISFANLWVS